MKIAHRWQDLNARAAGRDEGDELVRRCRQTLDRRYTSAGRAYHTWQHVGECLDWLDRYADVRSLEPEAFWSVSYAIFYHDAVHDAGAHDNEERSAGLARDELARLGLPQDLIDDTAALILATAHLAGNTHSPSEGAPRRSARAAGLTPLMLDIDLAILGASPERFDEYQRQIRDEYAHVDPDEFRARREEVLQAFLARPAIYTTAFFATRLETAARTNLRRAMDRFYSDSPRGYT